MRQKVVLLSAALALVALGGCAMNKAADTTRVAVALSEPDRGPIETHYTYMSPKATGLEDGIWVPTIPGKNVDVNYSKTPEGAVNLTLKTDRSGVLQTMWAGATTADAAKAAYDIQLTQMYLDAGGQLLDRVTSLAQPFIAAAATKAAAAPSPGGGDVKAAFLQILSDPAAMLALKQKLTEPPAIAPAPGK